MTKWIKLILVQAEISKKQQPDYRNMETSCSRKYEKCITFFTAFIQSNLSKFKRNSYKDVKSAAAQHNDKGNKNTQQNGGNDDMFTTLECSSQAPSQ